MSLILAAALATAPVNLPNCSWDHPGRDPFMGDVVTAVDDYKTIPAPVRARLKERMAARQYDEMVNIERDSINGKHGYNAAIRDMHFGSSGQICKTVSRTRWTAKNQERGLVYCESGQCILVPTVCRNVSRITRLPDRKQAEPEAAAGDTGAGEEPVAAVPPENGGGGGGAPSNDGSSFAQNAKPGAELPPLTGDGGAPFPPLGLPPPPSTLPPVFLPPIVIPPAPPYPPIPEPATWVLMAVGLAVLVVKRRVAQRRA